MGKLFDIIPTTNKARKKKYPYKIKFTDGRVVPLPSQYDFTDCSFIRRHGCIIAAFYMGLRFVNQKKSMKACLKHLQEHHPKGKHINYNLEQVCKAINKLAPGTPAKFYEKISKAEMKKALKRGDMVGAATLQVSGAGTYAAEMGESALGNIQRLENLLGGLETAWKEGMARLENARTQLAGAKEELQKAWPQEEELRNKAARLAELRVRWTYDRAVIEELVEILSASLLELMDEELLELAGELARTVSPLFAIPYLMGLMTMHSTGAAYDAACELLGPEGFGHGKLSEIALRVLADLFSCAHSVAWRKSLTERFDDDDWPDVDVDDLDKIATSPCNIFWSFPDWLRERKERPFADALDPRWLDAMLLADPFAASLPSSCWRDEYFGQKTLADIVFCLADLQDPPTRERIGAFFHEQALRGLDWGFRVMLWLRCCGRSDYQGIMEADLRRKKKDRICDISFVHYYRSFLALDDPLGFAEEAERCLRLIRDKKVPSPGRYEVKMLEELFVEARLKAASRGGEDEADACNDAETE